MRQVHFGVALDQILEPWRIPPGFLLAQRIAPGVNLAPQLLRPLARGRDAPLRPAPDGHPPLSPGVAVVDGEGPAARSVDADGKAAHIGIEDLIVPALGRFGIADGFLIQTQSVDHATHLSIVIP